MEENILQITEVCKSFGKTEVLKNINFTIKNGEVYGLVGQNGAGKTTLIRTITGLMKQNSGSIEMHNTKGYLGYMPQSCRFDSNMTVLSVLKFFSDLRRTPVEESVKQCGKLQLDKTKKVRHLSPGQQKKLQMIIAMTGDPDFYILDEPTAGLDPMATQEMLEQIRSIHERGKSILISSHILQDMDELCTKVAIMEQGKIIYDNQLESRYQIKTSALPENLRTNLVLNYQLEIDSRDNLITIKADEALIACLIKELTEAGIRIYGVKETSVSSIVNENMNNARRRDE